MPDDIRRFHFNIFCQFIKRPEQTCTIGEVESCASARRILMLVLR